MKRKFYFEIQKVVSSNEISHFSKIYERKFRNSKIYLENSWNNKKLFSNKKLFRKNFNIQIYFEAIYFSFERKKNWRFFFRKLALNLSWNGLNCDKKLPISRIMSVYVESLKINEFFSSIKLHFNYFKM